MTKTLTELTAEYYALISGYHHKDRDCHFYIQQTYSYSNEPYWEFLYYGYCWEVEDFFTDERNIEKYKYLTDHHSEFPRRQTGQEAEQDMRNFLEWIIKNENEVKDE